MRWIDDRAVAVVVGTHVLESEALRHEKIELEGPALPFPPQRVGDQDVDLGAVEGAAALVEFVVEAAVAEHAGQPVGGRVVHRRVADRLLGARGERHAVLVAEDLEQVVAQVEETVVLVGDLVLADEDVGVVLGEGPHPQHAVQRPRALVAVAGPQLGEAQRQVPVGPDLRAVDHEVVGAVHRLHAEPVRRRTSMAGNMSSEKTSRCPEMR